jgi:hypothetical protein
MPEVAPSANTAGYEPPLRPPTQFDTRAGTLTGITSNMTSAKTSKTFPIANRVQGLAATVPNKEPERPASSPMSAYNRANPPMYVRVKVTVRQRLASSPAVPTITPAVIGIIGYTQGVRLVRTPAPNNVANAANGLCSRAPVSPD